MSFQFVDNSDINRKARKLIRSHVMRGKNLGKVRIKRDRNPEPTASRAIIAYETGNTFNDDDVSNTTSGNLQSKSSILAVTRQLASDLTLLSSTSTIAPQTMLHLRQLAFFVLDVISPAEFCQHTRVTEWMWFQLVFSNEAYFHCNIAMALACAAFITGDESHSPVALYHMSQAYRSINQQLSSDEALSDTTIAVVASINVYDRLYGDPQKALVHLNGVTRMIELRGGIRELAKRNFIIAEKAFRSDIELALHCRSKPKFCSDDVPRHFILVDPKDCPQRQNKEEDEFVKSVLSIAQTISEHDRSRKMIVFWALMMGRISSLTKGDDLWLIPKLKILAHELELRTWPLVRDVLREFPWVKVSHEAQGEAFWNTTLAQPQLFNLVGL
ncbi:hypothetical protein O1611_g6976 [Lasiodiplodia mahajangana]|uniref:Uncharacterized protein n=1 Tax=Lasiodiplodia mahajangana TaxID=1108764 RepID=A0ACC2JGM4_9PEZI|nr:hypothetical protein O1611_g6976 [Lasiodiplodia mahajangana]